MPPERYYFHITDGSDTLSDHKGIDLNTISDARDRAIRFGPLILANVGAVVDVTNSLGDTVLKAPLVINGPEEASVDVLTGLPRRPTLLRLLEHDISSHNSGSSSIGLLLIDLDRLKDVNDALGYAAGDALLRHVADILVVETGDGLHTLARLDGDKFAVILRGKVRPQVVALAKALHGALRAPLQYGEEVIGQALSGGLALFPEHARAASDLVASADIALHEAKATGGGGLAVYTPTMRSDQERRFKALADARIALSEHYIVPHYQPKLSLHSGEIRGFEALLRINHPTLGLLLPGTIGDALDHPELAVSIGSAMQEQVFDDVQQWLSDGVQFGKIAINTSSLELLLSSYSADLLARLAARGIPADLLQLEVTETSMTGRGATKIAGELQKLQDRGVEVFLDDFGTGYGSLCHLRDFPISGIKIDRSFVGDVIDNGEAKTIIRVLVGLSRDLNLSLVAEGVETPEQASYLKSVGCEVVQGFLYAKALPAEALASFVERWDGEAIVKAGGGNDAHL